MKNSFLVFFLTFSIIMQPFYAFSAKKQQNSNRCDQLLYLEDLDLTEELVAAADEYYRQVYSPKKENNVLEFFKFYKWPVKLTRLASGENTDLKDPMFNIYKKDVVIDGKKKQLVAFLVGVPNPMKTEERRALDKFAANQNINSYGLPLKDPTIQHKENGLKFFIKEYNLTSAVFRFFGHQAMRVWNFLSESSPHWLMVNGSLRKIYSYPLYNDMKNLERPIQSEKGKIKYEKVDINMDPKNGQVVYLLDHHKSNNVEAVNKLGSGTRAAFAMILMTALGFYGYKSIDMGVIQRSDIFINIPALALIFSHTVSSIFNVLQGEKLPKLTFKNLFILAKNLRRSFSNTLLEFLKREQLDPSPPEEAYEKYHLIVKKDQHIRKAFVTLFGNEPPERDGRVIYKTKSIAQAIMGELFKLGKRQQQEDALAFVNTLPDHNPDDSESIKGITILTEYETTDDNPFENGESNKVTRIQFDTQHKSLEEAMIESSDTREKGSGEVETVVTLTMVPGELINGLIHQFEENLHFERVQLSVRPKLNTDEDSTTANK